MIIYKKIALGLAFSPRVEALLAECVRVKNLWGAELMLIHVGAHGPEEETKLTDLLKKVNLTRADVKVFWETGKPGNRILEICKRENADLLVAGALKKENIVQYYLGSVARQILRRSECSVLMFTNPSPTPVDFKNIVVNADDSPFVEESLRTACEFGVKNRSAWLHIVKEIKLYSLTMSAAEQRAENEYENLRDSLVKEEIDGVERLLQKIPHEGLKVNVKLVSGKSGFELSKFAERKNADLLVVGAPPRRFFFFDRVFRHDLEYIFADLPCNLLIVRPKSLTKPKGDNPWLK